MKPKERFLTALSLKEPDKVPLTDFLFSKALFDEVLGGKTEVYEGGKAVRCAAKLGFDAVWIPVGGYAGYSPEYINENTYIDEWGTTYRHNETSWPIDPPVDYPIKNREDYRNWSAPDPADPARVSLLKEAIAANNGELALLAGVLGPFSCANPTSII